MGCRLHFSGGPRSPMSGGPETGAKSLFHAHHMLVVAGMISGCRVLRLNRPAPKAWPPANALPVA